jgi:hypothetical protein
MAETKHSVRLWSEGQQLFILTAPDREVAFWLANRMMGRYHRNRLITRIEILYKLRVINTKHISSDRTKKAEPKP